MVARSSATTWADASGVAAQALAIRDRASRLARTDAHAWQDALAALESVRSGEGTDARRDFELERKLDHAAAVPLEIVDLGATAASLATLAAEHGDPAYRADAAVASTLAAASARAAAHLVEVNLTVLEGEERLARARAGADAASEAADAVRELLR